MRSSTSSSAAARRRKLNSQRSTQGAFGAAAADDSTAQLKTLARLHASGALTDAEFAAQKAKIIGS